MARHYLDHASTSTLRASARSALSDVVMMQADAGLGDPGRIHHEGLTARAMLENARELDKQSGMLSSAVDGFLAKVRAA